MLILSITGLKKKTKIVKKKMSTSTTLLVVRHGQDEDNAEMLLNGHRDRPLTELGVEQAGMVANKVKEIGSVDVVVSSPLQRAKITAKEIQKVCGIDESNFLIIDDLKERDFGVLTGKPVTSIKEVAGDNVLVTDKVTYFLDVPGSETFPKLLSRASSVLNEITSRFEGKRIAVVGHGDLNKMLRAAFMNWTWEEGLRTAYVGNTDIIQLPPPKGEETTVLNSTGDKST